MTIISSVLKNLRGCGASIVLFGLALHLSVLPLHGQILKDSISVKRIKKAIDYVYNFDFKGAVKASAEISNLYPGHPVTYLFRGMIIYWENYPLSPASAAHTLFEEDMRKCIELCDNNKDPAAEAEILLVNLCARGLLLLYFTDNDLSLEVFPIASSTYQCVRRSFDFTSQYSDFYFFTGVYNYYREAYPEAHPVYKTLAFLFPKGSKSKGLEDLAVVAKNSIILKAESYSFLSEIYLAFENNFQKAVFYSKNLNAIYPGNPEYKSSYIKNLLLVKQYNEAEKQILSSAAFHRNKYFQAQVSIFKGILQEKKYRNFKQAQQLYNQGIKDISSFRSYGDEFSAYAYFGLSRISDSNGDNENQKIYRKLALKLADYKTINFDE